MEDMPCNSRTPLYSTENNTVHLLSCPSCRIELPSRATTILAFNLKPDTPSTRIDQHPSRHLYFLSRGSEGMFGLAVVPWTHSTVNDNKGTSTIRRRTCFPGAISPALFASVFRGFSCLGSWDSSSLTPLVALGALMLAAGKYESSVLTPNAVSA